MNLFYIVILTKIDPKNLKRYTDRLLNFNVCVECKHRVYYIDYHG